MSHTRRILSLEVVTIQPGTEALSVSPVTAEECACSVNKGFVSRTSKQYTCPTTGELKVTVHMTYNRRCQSYSTRDLQQGMSRLQYTWPTTGDVKLQYTWPAGQSCSAYALQVKVTIHVTCMVYSHWPEPRLGQEPRTNGLYETMWVLSHYTWTRNLLSLIVLVLIPIPVSVPVLLSVNALVSTKRIPKHNSLQ